MNRKRWMLWNCLRDQQGKDVATSRYHQRVRKSNVRVEPLEQRQLLAADFTLELFHIADQEASVGAIQDAPRLSAVLTALRNQDLGDDGLPDNSLTLSSGDAIIPGLFYDASERAFSVVDFEGDEIGSGGIADIQIQNELGIQAIALGNHEFDFGTAELAGLIDGSAPGDFASLVGTDLEGLDFTGADFPYLSTNLNFATDDDLATLEKTGGQAPAPASVTSSVIIDVNGEKIGVVGATTPTLAAISLPGSVGISPTSFDPSPTPEQLDELAEIIQTEVDILIAENSDDDLDKVIVLAHMQQLDIEQSLAARLVDVDIIVAGGSNTRLLDSDDRLRGGDTKQGDYPIFVTNAGGTTTAVVNTDGSYKYVGRLVIGFDEDGSIDPTTYEEGISGAYATDAEGVAALGADGLIDPEIQAIVDAIEEEIIATESNVFGVSDVFLNGNRSGVDNPTDTDGVRTQETNLGNLTADANLAIAQKADETVVVSLKNGGGIRASIGQTVVPAGGSEAVRIPNEAVADSEGNLIKPEGGISQNDIQTTLAFNNGLVMMTLTTSELIALLEHGVGAIPDVSGRFPQVSGLKMSYDPSLPEGDRIINAAIFDDEGELIAKLVKDGEVVESDKLFRIVTLDFLARPRFDDEGNFTGGGDGYPFPNTNLDPEEGEVADPDAAARINVVALEVEGVQDGEALFADNGTEQDALAEYLNEYFPDADNAFSDEDTGRNRDQRIQNLAIRPDTVFPVTGTLRVTSELDSGEGSFRYAVRIASENPGVSRIRFSSRVDTVVLDSAVEYTGTQDLKISGNGVEIKASDSFVGAGVFISSAAADITLSKMTINGDFDEGETLANGIYIPVPGDAEGEVSLSLDRVTIKNVALHGLHIADQLEDSPAGVSLEMRRSTVVNNGIGQIDFDGVRVDEGGEGDLRAEIDRSSFNGNGGDGLELDERGEGSVYADVGRSEFVENGFFDQDYDADNPPVDEDGEIIEQDLDDGFDIDEAGDGGIYVNVTDTELINNFDEGIDFDEEDAGDVHIRLTRVDAIGNTDEGVKAEEVDEGNFSVYFKRVNINGNGDGDLKVGEDADEGQEGLQLEEIGDGNLYVRMNRVEANGNGKGGMKIEEFDEGRLTAKLDRVETKDNGNTGIVLEEDGAGGLYAFIQRLESDDNEGDGIELKESGDGLLLGRLRKAEFEDNEDFGLVAKQEDAGFGLLRLIDVEAEDNGEGPGDTEGVFLIGEIDD